MCEKIFKKRYEKDMERYLYNNCYIRKKKEKENYVINVIIIVYKLFTYLKI